MNKPYKIHNGIYLIGSAEISHPYDCCVYVIDAGDLVMIDTGAGKSAAAIVKNMELAGLDSSKLKHIIITHRHIDHIGALSYIKQKFNARVIAHKLDAAAIESGIGVGAEFYGVPYEPCKVNTQMADEEQSLQIGKMELKLLHIPGHTSGSIAIYCDIDKKRVLFGQDIHGPYEPDWGADIKKAKQSLQKLIDLKADILCEGHFGIYQPAQAVERYIRDYLVSL